MALTPPTSLPEAAEKRAAVRAMFDRIAPHYDRMNRLLTAGLDQGWRRAALDAACVARGARVLDLACGTGDLAALAAARGARVVGVDFAAGMLRGARARGVAAALARGDAAALPLADACVTRVVCGFALRNFVSLPEVFREIARVLADGGRVALLDVDRPRGRWMRAAHGFYFDRVVPRVGALLADRAAYAYLPRSTAYLPAEADLAAALADAGFESVTRRALGFGAVQIVSATRRMRT